MFLGSSKVSPSKRVHLPVKVIHQKFGDIVLIFRGCTTESKFLYHCGHKKCDFKQKIFLGSLKVLPSKRVHLHVKAIHKKIGDILLIFRSCSTESKFLYYCGHKKHVIFNKKYFWDL